MKKFILLLTLSLSLFAANNWPHPNISQAVFTLNVENRTPQNIVTEIDNTVNKIYFYTNLRNLSGQKLKHRWIYNGKNMAEVNFAPQGPRWRVYSSKNLWHNWTGKWSVQVINENNEVLLEKSFNYIKK
jgi:hypothetical protein